MLVDLYWVTTVLFTECYTDMPVSHLPVVCGLWPHGKVSMYGKNWRVPMDGYVWDVTPFQIGQ